LKVDARLAELAFYADEMALSLGNVANSLVGARNACEQAHCEGAAEAYAEMRDTILKSAVAPQLTAAR
jgi:hypothetical protein